MLAIRLQRVGRKGLAQYRVIVQDSHRSPKRGKIVAQLGSYDPHAKKLNLDKAEAQRFLNNGAQPSNRVAILFKAEGVKLPKWVVIEQRAERGIKNPDKLRKNRPADAEAPKKAAETDEKPADTEENPEADTDKPAEDAPKEEKAEELKEEKPVEDKAEESTEKDPPAEEEKAEKLAEEAKEAEAEKPAEEKAEEKPEEPAKEAEKAD